MPVAYVRGGRDARADDGWASVEASIELAPHVDESSLTGIEQFSHAEVVFRFHTLTDDDVRTGARHPRSNPDWPRVGIFAQRGSGRPNRIGVSICEVLGVDGRTVTVRGLDAIDGSPVLDIKPVMAEFLPRDAVRQPEWSHELMHGYWHGPQVDDDEGR